MHLRNISDDDIQDYLDDNLSPLQREYFETAMQRNHALAERVEEYRAVKSALKSEKAPLGSHEFVDAVMARIETVEPNPAAQGWRALDWLSLSAAAGANRTLTRRVSSCCIENGPPPSRISK